MNIYLPKLSILVQCLLKILTSYKGVDQELSKWGGGVTMSAKGASFQGGVGACSPEIFENISL